MNLAKISEKLNQNEELWNFISNTLLVNDVKIAVQSFQRVGENTSQMAQAEKDLLQSVKEDEGLAASLISDSAMNKSFENTFRRWNPPLLKPMRD